MVLETPEPHSAHCLLHPSALEHIHLPTEQGWSKRVLRTSKQHPHAHLIPTFYPSPYCIPRGISFHPPLPHRAKDGH